MTRLREPSWRRVFMAQEEKEEAKGFQTTASSTNKTKKGRSFSSSMPTISKRLLKRKKVPHFFRHILAHNFLSYRRFDIIFHRATIRLDGPSNSDKDRSADPTIKNRPIIVFHSRVTYSRSSKSLSNFRDYVNC